MDQFRGIFRLTYSGDAHIVLRTKVQVRTLPWLRVCSRLTIAQANPLNHKQPDIHLMGGSRGMLAAKQPLVVPMLLRLSGFKLNSYVVLVVSRQKGITLVFKTDPLQHVDINSTFDSIAVIQKFIQHEIEGQLRQMFREDLPGIIHRLSQQWVKAKVEAPYLDRRPTPIIRQRPRGRERDLDSVSAISTPPLYYSPYSRFPPIGLQPGLLPRTPPGTPNITRSHSASVLSASTSYGPTPSIASSPASTSATPTPGPDSAPSSFPDIENFDPTYGLRPEGLPKKSVFSGFRSLFSPSKGLGDLAEEPGDVDDSADETGSICTGQWDDFLSDYAPPPSSVEPDDDMEYESVPAVGGGTITRPRVYHSQSQINSPVGDSPPGGSSVVGRATPSVRSMTSRSSSVRPPPLSIPGLSRYGPNYNPYFAGTTPFTSRTPSRLGMGSPWHEDDLDSTQPFSSVPPVPPLYRSPPLRPGSPSSRLSSDMARSVPTPPPSEGEAGIYIPRARRLSAASSNLDRFQPGSPLGSEYTDHDPQIVLRPAVNNSISKLSTLSHSNHTLSPYTRTLEHFTVRSVPPRDATSTGPSSSVEKQPVKARRKRIFRLGGKPARPPDDAQIEARPPPCSSPVPLSEFDVSEMDRYFRSNDDLLPRYPDHLAPPNARRRVPYQS